MVDRTVLAARIAAIRDAVARVREVRPQTLARLYGVASHDVNDLLEFCRQIAARVPES